MNIPSNAKEIWLWFLSHSEMSKYGIAGLMGNLYAESSLVVNRKQGDFTSGYTRSASYTLDVDTGNIPKNVFARDSIGYGLAQWTYYTRKEELYDYAKSKGSSIGFLDVQLEFLMQELSYEYKATYSALKAATSVRGASDFVLKFYEMPADQSIRIQEQRASFGQAFYDAFKDLEPTVAEEHPDDISFHLDLIEQEIAIIRGMLSNG